MKKYMTSGNPNSWPRKVARKHRRLPDAVKALEKAGLDEYNFEHAIVEFCEERIRMAKGLSRRD
jgi:hypothetical protein